MGKKEAHNKALDMYLKAGGKTTNKTIADDGGIGQGTNLRFIDFTPPGGMRND